jgi:3-oxoacyl-[acyl-carrier protein] reductase
MMTEQRRVVLISGASRGIGAATARELGRRGYHVIVNYRTSADAAAAVVRDIESSGGTAQSIPADVCDPVDVAELVETALGAQGRIDALICNANTVNPPFAPLATLPWKEFIRKVNGELSGAYFLTQQVMEIMRAQGAGRIVYISSNSADRIDGSIAHSTAKAALNTFGRAVAAEAGKHGITVNIVAPGLVITDATTGVVTAEYRQHVRDNSVLGRVLEADDVARVIGLVVDDGFSGVTGTVIRVDGGLSVLETPGTATTRAGCAPQQLVGEN